MIFDNATSLTTNSSSMVYVLRDGMLDKAKELLQPYNIKIKTRKHISYIVKVAPSVVRIFDDDIPLWDSYEPEWPAYNPNHSFEQRQEEMQRFDERYKEAQAKYLADVVNVIHDKEFYWFIPDNEDNSMDEEEMKIYEYVSAFWTRLS